VQIKLILGIKLYVSFGRSKERAIELLVNSPGMAIEITSSKRCGVDVSDGV
jgi:hypothetical protein